MEKNLFIRCSEETYKLAHALAHKESRSLNKQIIHMIHKEAEKQDLDIKEIENSSLVKEKPQIKLGLQSLAETKSQVS